VIDATHPFADQIKDNAIEAARVAGIPLLAIRRPPWTPVEGDNWILVKDIEGAALALGDTAKRVFLTTGRDELRPFAACSISICCAASRRPRRMSFRRMSS
jgi:precorrin-6A/cobalt-precorrin-6A reductase